MPWSESNKRTGRNLKLLALTFLIGFTVLSSLRGNAYAQEKRPPKVRPGKGLEMILGDYAEYSNTLYTGEEKNILPSRIMIAVDIEGELNVVQVLSVEGDRLKSKSTIYYDRTQAKVEEGELLESGTETISIGDKKFQCTWEKRRNQGEIGTFWKCPELPFETFAKVQMEQDGKKLISELVHFGPDINDHKKADEFAKRLKRLNRTAPNSPEGAETRSFSFVFGLSGQNQYALLNLPEIRQQIALSREQAKQIQSLLKKADEEVTAVRLKTLKSIDSDFAELEADEKVRLVQTILANVKLLNVEANRKVLKVLNADQVNTLHKSLVQTIGVRAIESEPIGLMIKLTSEQKSNFDQLMNEFEKETAPLRVVRRQADFDAEIFEEKLVALDEKLKSILTAEQIQELRKLGD